MLHNFHIKMTAPNRGEVFMDGVKFKGVKAIEFHAALDHMPTVSLTLNAGSVEIEGGGIVYEDVTCMGDSERQFKRLGAVS